MTRRNLERALWPGLGLILASGIALLGLQAYEALVARTEGTALARSVFGVLLIAAGFGLAVYALRDARRAGAAYRATEEHFRSFIEAVTDYAIYTLDVEGKITSWNAGAARIKGYAAEEIIGRHFSRFYTEEDRLAGLPQKALEQSARAGKYEAEAWRVRKDGSRFLASVVIDPVRDASGRLIGFAKITRDVTERLEGQRSLEQTRAELAQSQKMEAVGQLSGGIAHDFNNLLHVIRGAAQLLQQRLQPADPEVQRYVEMVKRNVDRAAALTQRLLAFARRQPLAPKRIDTNRTVRESTELLRQTLGESIAIETVLSGGVWPVFADPTHLETALLNLAINARDAMRGGGKLTIETGNAFLDEAYAAAHQEVTSGQYTLIAVSDTGSGMTKEIAAKALEPFFTTKGPGEGTGLGLSQVYGFIKQSGGHLKIYSEPGEGTTVKLYLPRLAESGAGAVPAAASPAAAETSRGTILMVEDNEDARMFVAEMLRDLGYRVLVAADAAGALKLLEREPKVDLLFTDVGLPNGVNGRQLADQAQRRWPRLKVLFTTGYARNAIVHHNRLDPGVELIVKPFAQSDLAAKIGQVLASDRAVALQENR
jgi:PAS domain S-box-containing protein